MSDPRIESDDCGTRLIVDTSGLDFDQLTSSRTYITIPIGDALAFYEHVERTLGEWAREGISARRAVAAGVSLEAFVGEGVHTGDNIEDGEWEDLRVAGDHDRKARRENG